MLLLKKYHYRNDDAKTKSMLIISEFIDDKKQWKIEKNFDKKNDKKKIDIKLNKQVEIRNIINNF